MNLFTATLQSSTALLLTAASRIVESRLLHISVASMLAAWYKRYRKAFLAKLRRSEMELIYLRAHKQGANKTPNWLILRAPQYLSCRLVHLAVLYAQERDIGRLVWRSRMVRVLRNTQSYRLMASVHRCIHRCSPSQRARYRALDTAGMTLCWLRHLDDAGWMDRDSEDDAAMDAWVRRDNVEFVYNGQECRLPWPGPRQWY